MLCPDCTLLQSTRALCSGWGSSEAAWPWSRLGQQLGESLAVLRSGMEIPESVFKELAQGNGAA